MLNDQYIKIKKSYFEKQSLLSIINKLRKYSWTISKIDKNCSKNECSFCLTDIITDEETLIYKTDDKICEIDCYECYINNDDFVKKIQKDVDDYFTMGEDL